MLLEVDRMTKAAQPTMENKSGPKYSYVVAGAILSCSNGSKRVRLTMPVSHGVYIKDKAQMNIQDYLTYSNIKPFGACSALQGAPCSPAITIPWINGKEDTLIEGHPALLNISTNTCLHCGTIKIDDDGQDLGSGASQRVSKQDATDTAKNNKSKFESTTIEREQVASSLGKNQSNRGVKVFESKRKKYYDQFGNLADDLKMNDYTEKQLKQINPLFRIPFSNDPDILFSHFEIMATKYFAKGEMDQVVKDMIYHFRYGNGADYSNTILTKKVREHEATKEYIKVVKKAVINELRNNDGNLLALKYSEDTSLYKYLQKKAEYPDFSSRGDILGGLTITIHDTWANEVEVRDYSVENNKFTGKLHFTIYDHFGLDQQDVEKKYSLEPGFRSWFILQHSKEFNGRYKPFNTIIEFDVPFEGEING